MIINTALQAEILKAFDINDVQQIVPLGNGLINSTFKIIADEEYVLQKINTNVFTNAKAIFNNQNLLEKYLQTRNIQYDFVFACKTIDGNNFYKDYENNFYRVFPFVKKSITIDIVENEEQAFEAALAFGNFTNTFKDINTNLLEPVIPNFHNIALRYNQFLEAIKIGNAARIGQSKKQINTLLAHKSIVDYYEHILQNKHWKQRVTHHDTKISNVLFNDDNKATHVIDLDTVMPGFFISDVGDMMRTYLSPANEEEASLEKIIIRKEMYNAIIEGYKQSMQTDLTKEENGNIFYAGKFMIYMQALRFLTDYLNDDKYYGAKYEQHNFVRACNQINLLEKYIAFGEGD